MYMEKALIFKFFNLHNVVEKFIKGAAEIAYSFNSF